MTVNSFVFFPFVAQDPCATLRQCSKSCTSQNKSCDTGFITHPCVVVTQCDDLSHLPPNPNNTCYASHGPATTASTSTTTTMTQTSATATRSMGGDSSDIPTSYQIITIINGTGHNVTPSAGPSAPRSVAYNPPSTSSTLVTSQNEMLTTDSGNVEGTGMQHEHAITGGGALPGGDDSSPTVHPVSPTVTTHAANAMMTTSRVNSSVVETNAMATSMASNMVSYTLRRHVTRTQSGSGTVLPDTDTSSSTVHPATVKSSGAPTKASSSVVLGIAAGVGALILLLLLVLLVVLLKRRAKIGSFTLLRRTRVSVSPSLSLRRRQGSGPCQTQDDNGRDIHAILCRNPCYGVFEAGTSSRVTEQPATHSDKAKSTDPYSMEEYVEFSPPIRKVDVERVNTTCAGVPSELDESGRKEPQPDYMPITALATESLYQSLGMGTTEPLVFSSALSAGDTQDYTLPSPIVHTNQSGDYETLLLRNDRSTSPRHTEGSSQFAKEPQADYMPITAMATESLYQSLGMGDTEQPIFDGALSGFDTQDYTLPSPVVHPNQSGDYETLLLRKDHSTSPPHTEGSSQSAKEPQPDYMPITTLATESLYQSLGMGTTEPPIFGSALSADDTREYTLPSPVVHTNQSGDYETLLLRKDRSTSPPHTE